MTSDVVNIKKTKNLRLEEAIQELRSVDVINKDILNEFVNLVNEGCDEAYYYLGSIYEEGGDGIEKDLDNAIFYYTKSVEEYNYLEGYLSLGRIHYFGIGVEKDFKSAFEFYNKVLQHSNNAIANLNVGKMYQNGEGVDVDFDKARECYQKAIDKGYVFGVTYMALLEKETGHKLRSVWLRVRAAIYAFFLTLKNQADSRLRYY